MPTQTAPREARPTQRGALYAFLALCVVVLLDNALFLGRVANTPRDGTDELSSWWVVAPQGAAFLVYAWVWVTVMLVWSSRENLASMLADSTPVGYRHHPRSGLSTVTRAALYAGSVLAGAAVPLLGGSLSLSEVPQVLLASAMGHSVAVLAGILAAGVISYPAVILWRALRLRPDDVATSGRATQERLSEREVRLARQGLVGLAALLLLLFPVATCLALAYDSPYGRRVDILPLLGVVRDGVVVDSPLLLWTGRLVLVVMVLVTVRVVTARKAMHKALSRHSGTGAQAARARSSRRGGKGRQLP